MGQRPLEGIKGVEEAKKDSLTQVERWRREEKYKKHQLYFSVISK